MTPKNRGLGRGLNALFEDEESQTAVPSAAQMASTEPMGGRRFIGVDQITPGAFQPRTLFNEESLNELAESIKIHGLLQPVIVRVIKGHVGRYELIAGERRWRAAQKVNLHEVPAIIMDLTDEDALEIALVENLQREDLNPVDEAMGYRRLMDQFSHTQEQLAEMLGKSRSHVANMLRLLALPDIVLAHLERGDLSMGHARALVTAKNVEALAKQIVNEGLSVRETEKLAADSTGRVQKSKSSSGAKAEKDVDTAALEQDLSNKLGMRVSIDSRDYKTGKISVEFKSLDQLDEVIKRLSQAE